MDMINPSTYKSLHRYFSTLYNTILSALSANNIRPLSQNTYFLFLCYKDEQQHALLRIINNKVTNMGFK
ncbi:LOW QUALITY PROTEIN: hypothetical protein PanWU01x14_315540 [Parasponia andersonii]|uniref:Uncharacterized protein n=1 Tax=Parasponia andersonii TaxID=3476 RepID=A0A2P5ANE2_PARAD|nr:LOW QUALITY PROTEIN: hypothetical protein PanWU01x14_315540 [Parasponia andersonii]